MSTPENDLTRRCADYLKTGPPAHMTDYMPDSLTEIIIAQGGPADSAGWRSHKTLHHAASKRNNLLIMQVRASHRNDNPCSTGDESHRKSCDDMEIDGGTSCCSATQPFQSNWLGHPAALTSLLEIAT